MALGTSSAQLAPPLAAVTNQSVSVQYGSLLASILRNLAVHSPSTALRADPQAFEKMRRDLAISKALYQRKLMAAGSSVSVEAASGDKRDVLLAAIVEHALKRINGFSNARFNLAEAILRGVAWARPAYVRKTCSLAATPPITWWLCHSLEDVSVYRTRQHRTGDGVYVWQVYATDAAGTGWRDMPADWILHRHEPREESLGYGSALADELYDYWWSKAAVLIHGLQYVQLWCGGVMALKIDSLRAAGDTPTGEDRATAFLEEAQKLKESGILLHDARDEAVMLQPPAGGSQIALDLLEYFDQALVSRILGSVLPTGGGQGVGSLARAEVEQDTTVQLTGHDRAALAATLTEGVVEPFLRHNAPALRRLGLDGREIGALHLTDEEQQDLEKNARTLEAARALGLPIKREEAYARLGLTAPSEGDDVIAPAPAAPAMPGGPGSTDLGSLLARLE